MPELAILVGVSTAAALIAAHDPVSRRPDVRRHAGVGGAARQRHTSTRCCRGGSAAAAVVGIGAVTGSRFANTDPITLLRYLGAALGSFAVAISVASLFVLAADRAAAAAHRRRGGGVCARRAGHHDGAGAGAAPRPDLHRRASPVALHAGVAVDAAVWALARPAAAAA